MLWTGLLMHNKSNQTAKKGHENIPNTSQRKGKKGTTGKEEKPEHASNREEREKGETMTREDAESSKLDHGLNSHIFSVYFYILKMFF
jgi:hypothetical protein